MGVMRILPVANSVSKYNVLENPLMVAVLLTELWQDLSEICAHQVQLLCILARRAVESKMMDSPTSISSFPRLAVIIWQHEF